MKFLVVESPVFALLEEVGVAVAVLNGVVDVVGDALPVGYRLGIAVRHGGPLLWVEPVVFVPLETEIREHILSGTMCNL